MNESRKLQKENNQTNDLMMWSDLRLIMQNCKCQAKTNKYETVKA